MEETEKNLVEANLVTFEKKFKDLHAEKSKKGKEIMSIKKIVDAISLSSSCSLEKIPKANRNQVQYIIVLYCMS